jgi:magnesium-protoporphyrin O-methyltransferase
MFGPRFARHLASRYRKRGLDKTAARMVAYLVDEDSMAPASLR